MSLCSAISDLSCYVIIYKTWGESLNMPSQLIFCLPTLLSKGVVFMYL